MGGWLVWLLIIMAIQVSSFSWRKFCLQIRLPQSNIVPLWFSASWLIMLCIQGDAWTVPAVKDNITPAKRSQAISPAFCLSQLLCSAERAEMGCSFYPFLGVCCFILPVHRVKWTSVTELKSEEWYRNRCFRCRSSEGTRMLRQWQSGHTEKEKM